MITINTVSENYFDLDGIRFARIYQPLKQGLQQIGLYSIYDTKKQLVSSTHFNQFLVNGVVYGTQALTIAAILAVTWSGASEYDVELLKNTIANAGNLSIKKIYASVAAMNADFANPLTTENEPILKGQLVVISQEGADNGKVFRRGLTVWEYVMTIGDLSKKADINEFNLVGVNWTHGIPATTDDIYSLSEAISKVPAVLQKGGIKIVFRSSSNSISTAILMNAGWSTIETDWGYFINGKFSNNPEYIWAVTDENNILLFGIKTDGSIDWTVGIPKPIKDYFTDVIQPLQNTVAEIADDVQANVNEFNLLGVAWTHGGQTDDIYTFAEAIAKVPAVLQKGGIKIVFRSSTSSIATVILMNSVWSAIETDWGYFIDGKNSNNPEYLWAITDENNVLLLGIKKDGSVDWSVGIPKPLQDSFVNGKFSNNPEYLWAVTDENNILLFGIKKDGTVDWNVGIPKPIKDYFTTMIQPYLKSDDQKQVPFLVGGNIAVLGTSISNDYVSMNLTGIEQCWFSLLINQVGGVLLDKATKSGSCAVYDNNGTSEFKNLQYGFYQRIADLAGDFQTIFVELGANDYNAIWGASSLGSTFDFEKDLSTYNTMVFVEAYIKGIRTLLANWATANIICVITKPMSDAWANAIKTIAAHYNLCAIDCRNAYQSSDGIHPYGLAQHQNIADHIVYSLKDSNAVKAEIEQLRRYMNANFQRI